MSIDTAAPQHKDRVRPFFLIIRGLNAVAPSAVPLAQKGMTRLLYQFLNRKWENDDVRCLNYGFVAAEGDIEAGLQGQPDRYGLALYERVVGAEPLAGKDVLEVGCGRGGGTAFVAASAHPRSVRGIDLSPRAIERCMSQYSQPGLEFLVGDAEKLPFDDGSLDAVINVESSHCYPRPEAFFAEVHRVLRPGGALLFADLRPAEAMSALRAQVRAVGFEVEEDELITADVVRALQRDAPRREAIVAEHTSRLLRPAVRDFVAVPGSQTFRMLASGELEYVCLRARRR